jgi:hypothetical protein
MTGKLSDVQEFKDELIQIALYHRRIEQAIEFQRRHLFELETIARKNGRNDIADLLSFTHHVVLNSLNPVLNTVDQGVSRAHLLAQRDQE